MTLPDHPLSIPVHIFHEQRYPDLPHEIRLTTLVTFWKTANKSIEPYLYGIIDTGAHFSIIPGETWDQLQPEIITTKYPLRPLGSRVYYVELGRVMLSVFDTSNRPSPRLKVTACRAPFAPAPLLLGFHGFLTDAALRCDYPRNDVKLVFPRASAM